MNLERRSAQRFVVGFLSDLFALTHSVWAAGQALPATHDSSPSGRVLLREGTEVKLKLPDELSSKTAVEGDLLNLVLDQDLKVGEVTVAKAGSVAVGTIADANKAGMLGRPGDLGMRLEYLRAGDAAVGYGAARADKEREKKEQPWLLRFFSDRSA